MIKINRTTEYGLIAIRYMDQKRSISATESVTSAREISDRFGLPFEITAKTLQRLKDIGIIFSAQGSRGGYTLQKNLKEISLAHFMSVMEGPVAVVPCANTEEPSQDEKAKNPCHCEYQAKCEMQGVMGKLNKKVNDFLLSIPLSEIIGSNSEFSPLVSIERNLVC